MSIIAVLVIFQPFVNLAEAIIKFFAETIGLSWGLSIVMLTLTVRAFTLPLSLTGIRSMRRMQIPLAITTMRDVRRPSGQAERWTGA